MTELNARLTGYFGETSVRVDVDDAGLADFLASLGPEWLGLSLTMPLKRRVAELVPSLDEAMAHIEKYGSLHTESIVTKDYANAQRFLNEVNSSTVLVNASTRLSGGGDYGMGAVVGISTGRLHARGPVGPRELTTYKWQVRGNGQLRN